MKQLHKSRVLKYIYDQLTGNFIGFVIGASATGLLSHFFETRSFKNLWGITAKKTVVDKETFSNLEWIISIIIGFVFFEVFNKVIKEWLNQNSPRYKRTFFRWLIKEQLHEKTRTHFGWLNQKRMVFFSAVHQGVKQAIGRYSNRA